MIREEVRRILVPDRRWVHGLNTLQEPVKCFHMLTMSSCLFLEEDMAKLKKEKKGLKIKKGCSNTIAVVESFFLRVQSKHCNSWEKNAWISLSDIHVRWPPDVTWEGHPIKNKSKLEGMVLPWKKIIGLNETTLLPVGWVVAVAKLPLQRKGDDRNHGYFLLI